VPSHGRSIHTCSLHPWALSQGQLQRDSRTNNRSTNSANKQAKPHYRAQWRHKQTSLVKIHHGALMKVKLSKMDKIKIQCSV